MNSQASQCHDGSVRRGRWFTDNLHVLAVSDQVTAKCHDPLGRTWPLQDFDDVSLGQSQPDIDLLHTLTILVFMEGDWAGAAGAKLLDLYVYYSVIGMGMPSPSLRAIPLHGWPSCCSRARRQRRKRRGSSKSYHAASRNAILPQQRGGRGGE